MKYDEPLAGEWVRLIRKETSYDGQSNGTKIGNKNVFTEQLAERKKSLGNLA